VGTGSPTIPPMLVAPTVVTGETRAVG
jgi:hypothetical protein